MQNESFMGYFQIGGRDAAGIDPIQITIRIELVAHIDQDVVGPTDHHPPFHMGGILQYGCDYKLIGDPDHAVAPFPVHKLLVDQDQFFFQKLILNLTGIFPVGSIT